MPDCGHGETFELNVYRQSQAWMALLLDRGCNPEDGKSFIDPSSWRLRMPWEINETRKFEQFQGKDEIFVTLTNLGIIVALANGKVDIKNITGVKNWIKGAL